MCISCNITDNEYLYKNICHIINFINIIIKLYIKNRDVFKNLLFIFI